MRLKIGDRVRVRISDAIHRTFLDSYEGKTGYIVSTAVARKYWNLMDRSLSASSTTYKNGTIWVRWDTPAPGSPPNKLVYIQRIERSELELLPSAELANEVRVEDG